jgi:hypothetical protein
MTALARVVWVATGLVFAARSLIEFAQPDYWEPVTTLDWSAVWLTSLGWLLFAPSVLLLGRLAPTRAVLSVSMVVASGALLTGLANAIEDGFDVQAFGTLYVIGFMTAWLGLLALAWAFSAAGRSRLMWLALLSFVGILMTNIGGGVSIAVGLGSVALAPDWYRRATPAKPDPTPAIT